MTYISTRGGAQPTQFIDVLMSGLAPDGGLFVPEIWPKLDMAGLQGKSYVEVAEAVIGPFTDGQIPRADLARILSETYTAEIFGSVDITPIVQLEGDLYLMELFHGPTLAFKDVALQFLGRLFDHVLEKSGKHLTIIGATSGDTGSAAIEACRGRKNITVTILHPHGRTSDVQRRQMTTVMDDNIHNIAIKGNFDDCQALVKQAFADTEIRNRNLSAINSINWARIIAQSVYYVWACLKLGGTPNFVVPTGNFGNVYAAYVARQMGAPIGRLVIGSNHNDILTRFFESGSMQLEDVIPSHSPSMDIQVSSNFERYLWDLVGHEPKRIQDIMNVFKMNGVYGVSQAEHAKAAAMFTAVRCPDDVTLDTIRDIHARTQVLIDPHTAVGVHAALTAKLPGVTVALACAHPAKFPDAVERATGMRPDLPPALSDLLTRPERFEVLENDFAALKATVLSYQ
jgi:threonine synthase